MTSKPRPTQGYHYAMPYDEYRADPALSQSAIKRYLDMTASRAKEQDWLPPRPPTASQEMGMLFEAIAFMPEKLYQIPDGLSIDWSKADIKTATPKPPATHYDCACCDSPIVSKEKNKVLSGGKRAHLACALQAEAQADSISLAVSEGKVLIADSQMEMAEAICAKLDKHTCMEDGRTVADLLRGGRTQVAAFWSHGLSECKGLYDVLTDDIVIDYKTCQGGNASPKEWPWQVRKWRYDFQAAFYIAGAELIEKRPHRFLWVVQETDPPYDVAVYECPREVIDDARHDVDLALDTYTRCHADGKFPGYPHGCLDFELPPRRV
jgi:hypothetical protein